MQRKVCQATKKKERNFPNERKRDVKVRMGGILIVSWKKPGSLSVARLKARDFDPSCSPTPSTPPLHPVHPFFSASSQLSAISLPQGQRGVSVIMEEEQGHTHTVCTSTHMYVTHVRAFFNDSQRESTVNPLPFMD